MPKKTKFIVITGGVLSGLGKGIFTSSLGKLLQSRGFEVVPIKIDPYLNIDAGTMNPIEHGEVFVLDDGSEVDMDLGTYERFLGLNMKSDNNITTGKIYQKVIKKGSKANKIYSSLKTRECFRHRWEFVPRYKKKVECKGLVFSGHDKSGEIMQILEIPKHPFFMASQFHPEFTTRILKPNPMFFNFIKAAKNSAESKGKM